MRCASARRYCRSCKRRTVMDERGFTRRTQRQRRSERKARGRLRARRATPLEHLKSNAETAESAKKQRETLLWAGCRHPVLWPDEHATYRRLHACRATAISDGNSERGGLGIIRPAFCLSFATARTGDNRPSAGWRTIPGKRARFNRTHWGCSSKQRSTANHPPTLLQSPTYRAKTLRPSSVGVRLSFPCVLTVY